MKRPPAARLFHRSSHQRQVRAHGLRHEGCISGQSIRRCTGCQRELISGRLATRWRWAQDGRPGRAGGLYPLSGCSSPDHDTGSRERDHPLPVPLLQPGRPWRAGHAHQLVTQATHRRNTTLPGHSRVYAGQSMITRIVCSLSAEVRPEGSLLELLGALAEAVSRRPPTEFDQTV